MDSGSSSSNSSRSVCFLVIENFDTLLCEPLGRLVKDWLLFGEKLGNIPLENIDPAKSSHTKYLIYGGASGAVSRTVTAPLERLKILNQVQHMDGDPRYKGVQRLAIALWPCFLLNNSLCFQA